jgi:hypothetical protein
MRLCLNIIYLSLRMNAYERAGLAAQILQLLKYGCKLYLVRIAYLIKSKNFALLLYFIY